MGVRVLVAACLLTSFTNAYAQDPPRVPRGQMEVIGSFSSRGWTVPMAINNRGVVVGFIASDTTSGFSAFTWTHDDGFRLLLDDAIALDINSRGDIVGERYGCTSYPWGYSCAPRGFLWNAQNGLVDLAGFTPAAINDRGEMAGICLGAQVPSACALYDGALTEWRCDLPECGSSASGINARGDVVGFRSTLDGTEAMLFLRDGTQMSLGEGTAEDINDAGIIVGRIGRVSSAAVWTGHGVFENVQHAAAWAVNARGEAVGVQFGDGPNAAFFWDATHDVFVYLDPAGSGSEATDINDRGDIVGTISQLGVAVIWHLDFDQ